MFDEDSYKKEAVKGYFDYLGRAFVQTKLTEEGEVVKATQDIFNVWDDFLENPDSFIPKEDDEDEEDEDYSYPKLEDFAYNGSFESSVFDNIPVVTDSDSFSVNSKIISPANVKSAEKSSKTGDNLFVILLIFAALFTAAGCSRGIYLIKLKKVRVNDCN